MILFITERLLFFFFFWNMIRISRRELMQDDYNIDIISINICCLVEFTIIFIVPFRADRSIVILLENNASTPACTLWHCPGKAMFNLPHLASFYLL